MQHCRATLMTMMNITNAAATGTNENSYEIDCTPSKFRYFIKLPAAATKRTNEVVIQMGPHLI